jgi:hypothetical protein
LGDQKLILKLNILIKAPEFIDEKFFDVKYVFKDTSDLLSKINTLQSKPKHFWTTLKQYVRNSFLSGNICNQNVYIDNMQKLLLNLQETHVYE